MTPGSRKIIVIGGGISGLCAGVYAQASGYQVEILEKHVSPGGLAASWQRGEYRFETCIHWLVGSATDGLLNAQWREVLDIDRLKFFYTEEYQCVDGASGQSLHVYSNVERMEAEFLRVAPEDAEEIKAFTGEIRHIAELPLQDLMDGPWPERAWAVLRLVPRLPLLQQWAAISARDYAKRIKNDLLGRFFGDSATAGMSIIALVFMFAWMNQRNAGYPIGGSRAIIDLIVERFQSLGGKLRTGIEVGRIIVEQDVATGVHLADGEIVTADWIISAADGHSTIYGLLEAKYSGAAIDRLFAEQPVFPSYVQVSLGVAQDLSGEPGYLQRSFSIPLFLDPETELGSAAFRIFQYDPTFAPPGKTAVTCFLPTFNFAYWVELRQTDPQRYEAEKDRIAEVVISTLEERLPGIRERVETIDVSTPASVVHFTGNWKGSMEGFLPTPDSFFASGRQTLPGLGHFMRVGQWIRPGGGLPTGLLTARAAIRTICRKDEIVFLPDGTTHLTGAVWGRAG